MKSTDMAIIKRWTGLIEKKSGSEFHRNSGWIGCV